MYQLPDASYLVGLIGSQQMVQEGRAGARQSGDKNWSVDRLIEDFGCPSLLIS